MNENVLFDISSPKEIPSGCENLLAKTNDKIHTEDKLLTDWRRILGPLASTIFVNRYPITLSTPLSLEMNNQQQIIIVKNAIKAAVEKAVTSIDANINDSDIQKKIEIFTDYILRQSTQEGDIEIDYGQTQAIVNHKFPSQSINLIPHGRKKHFEISYKDNSLQLSLNTESYFTYTETTINNMNSTMLELLEEFNSSKIKREPEVFFKVAKRISNKNAIRSSLKRTLNFHENGNTEIIQSNTFFEAKAINNASKIDKKFYYAHLQSVLTQHFRRLATIIANEDEKFATAQLHLVKLVLEFVEKSPYKLDNELKQVINLLFNAIDKKLYAPLISIIFLEGTLSEKQTGEIINFYKKYRNIINPKNISSYLTPKLRFMFLYGAALNRDIKYLSKFIPLKTGDLKNAENLFSAMLINQIISPTEVSNFFPSTSKKSRKSLANHIAPEYQKVLAQLLYHEIKIISRQIQKAKAKGANVESLNIKLNKVIPPSGTPEHQETLKTLSYLSPDKLENLARDKVFVDKLNVSKNEHQFRNEVDVLVQKQSDWASIHKIFIDTKESTNALQTAKTVLDTLPCTNKTSAVFRDYKVTILGTDKEQEKSKKAITELLFALFKELKNAYSAWRQKSKSNAGKSPSPSISDEKPYVSITDMGKAGPA